MEVLVSPTAKEFVDAHGGAVYVHAHSYRCCSSSSLTLLDIETVPPKDLAGFNSADSNDIDVKYYDGFSGRPNQLIIELRGVFRRHLVAYWDGCAFKI